MKLWIINILQYIVNSIESEEDKTLPEDYFKRYYNKITTIIGMSEEEKKKILELYKIHERISPEFSCTLCKQVFKIRTCKNCPIYCQTFNLD